MNTAKQIKICRGCKKSFTPVLSDEELMHLWHDEQEIETHKEMTERYGKEFFSPLQYPRQMLCDKCATNPPQHQAAKVYRLIDTGTGRIMEQVSAIPPPAKKKPWWRRIFRWL